MKKFYAIIIVMMLAGICVSHAQTGFLDRSFGIDGQVVTSFQSENNDSKAVATQPDRKILIAASVYATGSFTVIRLNTNGSLDSSFGINGTSGIKVTSGSVNVKAVVIQPDGKIVVGGSAVVSSGEEDFVIVRFNNTGSIDSTFANNGMRTISFLNGSNSRDVLRELILKPNGQIFAGGFAINTFSGSTYTSFVQLKPNGSLDSSFGTNGTAMNYLANSVIDFSMAMLTNEKVIVGSWINYDVFSILRHNRIGTVDSAFGTNGIGDTIMGFRVTKALLQEDGKVVMAGFKNMGGIDFAIGLARFSSTGRRDSSFGKAGVVYKNVEHLNVFDTYIYRQPDGKYMVSGSNWDYFLMRFNSNGTTDSTFGKRGLISTKLKRGSVAHFGTALQNDGKIVLAGTATIGTSYYFALARYEKDPVVYYNSLVGQVYLDRNLNGTREQAEPFFTEANIVTTKLNIDTISSHLSKPNFLLDIDTGSYITTIVPYLPYYKVLPAVHSASYATYFNTDTVSFAVQPIGGKRDLQVSIIPLSPVRPVSMHHIRSFAETRERTP